MLWLDPTRKLVEKASFRGNYVPHGPYYKHHDFVTLSVLRNNVRYVEYLNPDGSLLGVRAPKPKSRPSTLEPNETTWFITYSGKNFKVNVDPATGLAQEINLVPKNLHQAEKDRHCLTSQEVSMGGIHFLVFLGANGDILGAELDR
ncbi:uncharacterized protein LOC117175079 [Belonocnema kinseyi]|uniref:uncharacterized protein LOC117175079 n=1 Tax=Belonocnema kinseyi TaxID=2817044 RepID=UPI00143D6CDD|nr:uncharacterized protein LOC117175079 [Belonocnema kinseyi]